MVRSSGNTRAAPSCRSHDTRLRRIVFRLQEATHPGGADAAGFRLRALKGSRAGRWSVRLTGPRRVVFRFEDGEVLNVDLIDCR